MARGPRFGADVVGRDGVLLGRGGEFEENAENLYGINVLLPDLETTRAKVNRERAVRRDLVAKSNLSPLGA